MATAASIGMQNVSHNQIWNFSKLKGQENYEPWSKKMRNALIYTGLWEVVETGRSSYPEDTATTAPQRMAYEIAVRTWEEKNSQGAALVYSMCEDKPAEVIEDEASSYDRWEKLESNYVSSGFILRVIRFQELLNTRLLTSSNSLETYMAGIRNKAKELRRMSAPIPDWILVTMLLNNLDGKFKEFVHRLLVHMKDKTPDFDEIVALLYEEERLLKKDTKEQALFTAMKKFNKDQDEKKRGSSSSSNRGGSGGNNSNNSNAPESSKNPNSSNYKGDGKPPECFKCPLTESGKKRTHWPFYCWSLHEEKAEQWFKDLKKNKANKATGSGSTERRPDDFEESNTHISATALLLVSVADEEEVSFEDFWGVQQSHSETPEEQVENSPVLALAANVGEQSTTSLDWLINSGCTNHMFFNEQHFDDYRAYEAGVIIADGTTVAITGRGTIEMEWLLPDGSSNLIRLDDVLHVPQLKCGLFSISQATRKGLGVVFFDDACQITKDGIAIGCAPKVNDTYILNISQPSTQIARLINREGEVGIRCPPRHLCHHAGARGFPL